MRHEHVSNRMVQLRDLTGAFITYHCRCEYPVFPSTVASASTQPCEKSHLHLPTQQQEQEQQQRVYLQRPNEDDHMNFIE